MSVSTPSLRSLQYTDVMAPAHLGVGTHMQHIQGRREHRPGVCLQGVGMFVCHCA